MKELSKQSGPTLIRWLRGEVAKFAGGATLAQWGGFHGLTESDIHRWENGKNTPSWEKLVQLSQELPEQYSLLDVLLAAELIEPAEVKNRKLTVAPDLPVVPLEETIERTDRLTRRQKDALLGFIADFDELNGS